MKIKDVKTYVLEAVLAEPFAYSQAWYERRGALLVEILGEDGTSGWGEAFGPPRLTAPIVDFYKPLLVGADALATDLLWQSLYNGLRDHGQKGLAIKALSAVDIALWDLKGHHLGLPIYRLLGGPLRERVQAYATGFYRKHDGDPLSYLVAEAEERAAAGFSAIKLKLGFGINQDVRPCQAVRKAIGDDIGIMVDANHAYDAPAAIQLGRRIEELDIGWFEEPVPPEDIVGYRAVKAGLAMPIAGGEAEFTRWGFRPLLVERAMDTLQPDTCAAGGISECKKIADMANAFGVRVNPHVWGTGVALAASLQLIATLPHNPPALNPIEPLVGVRSVGAPYPNGDNRGAYYAESRLCRDSEPARPWHRDRSTGSRKSFASDNLQPTDHSLSDAIAACNLECRATYTDRLQCLVDRVVHRGDKVLDVAAIERRDEGAPADWRISGVIASAGASCSKMALQNLATCSPSDGSGTVFQGGRPEPTLGANG